MTTQYVNPFYRGEPITGKGEHKGKTGVVETRRGRWTRVRWDGGQKASQVNTELLESACDGKALRG